MKSCQRLTGGTSIGSSIFEREIGKFLETQCCLVIHQIDLRGPKFTIRKTVDYVCCHNDGSFWAVEVKQTKTDSFTFARIKSHQCAALTEVSETEHGQSFLALNFRSPGVGSAYLIPWDYWCDFENEWSKKSVRRVEAEEEFWKFELERITSGWIMPNVHGPRIKLTQP